MPRVEPSPIAGRGLFATEAVAAGAAVLSCRPPDFGGLNHSCDPNLGWTDDRTLAAIRAIAPGEELTVDYATAVDDPAFVLYCHCGTYRCRQVIEGGDWQIPQLQLRYAGRWVPRVQQRIDSAAR